MSANVVVVLFPETGSLLLRFSHSHRKYPQRIHRREAPIYLEYIVLEEAGMTLVDPIRKDLRTYMKDVKASTLAVDDLSTLLFFMFSSVNSPFRPSE